MAEIITTSTEKRKGVKRLVKKSTRVDLTPMVDLGFLLITFFVFTTTMAKPTVMNVNMPYDKDSSHDPICESCVLTVVLEKENFIRYYEGAAGKNTILKETSFTNGGIRNVIIEKMKTVKIARGTSDEFVLIIKPSVTSNFKNFVDITDEVTINQVKRYYIDELNGEDISLLALYHK